MSERMSTHDVIRSFANLKEGWNFGDGGPISQQVIDSALKFLDALLVVGYAADAAPGVNGTICFGCDFGNWLIEFEVEADLTYRVMIDKKGSSSDSDSIWIDGLTFDSAVEHMSEFWTEQHAAVPA